MNGELLSLFEEDGDLRHTFEIIVKERKVRFGDLLSSLETEKNSVIEQLEKLEKEHLIKSQNAPGQVEDLNWYSITARGLSLERKLRRQRKLKRAELV